MAKILIELGPDLLQGTAGTAVICGREVAGGANFFKKDQARGGGGRGRVNHEDSAATFAGLGAAAVVRSAKSVPKDCIIK